MAVSSIWRLQPGIIVGGKQVFVVGKDDDIQKREEYLATQLKAAFRLEKGVDSLAPPNRNKVCRELVDLLNACIYQRKSSRGVKEARVQETVIVRTDIRKFYESVDQERLLRMLEDSPYISPKAAELARKLVEEYRELTGNLVGLPRGVGASSLLAEIFMIGFDVELQMRLTAFMGVAPKMYRRFVDDIIIVFQLDRRSNKAKLQRVLKEVAERYSLKIHTGEKTKIIKIKEPPKEAIVFDYLGYEFSLGRRLCLDIADKRFEKLKARIERSFQAYARRPSVKAADLLRKRIWLISSNIRFNHNGNTVTAGINQSNPLIPQSAKPKRIFALDKVYRDCLKKYVKYEDNMRILTALGSTPFRDGFESRRFIRMPSYEKYINLAIWKQEHA
jgi:hypothetical protein